MSPLASSEKPESVSARRRHETRMLKLLLAVLAVVTAVASFTLVSTAHFTLLVLPFVVFVAFCAAVSAHGWIRSTAPSKAAQICSSSAALRRSAIAFVPAASGESAVNAAAHLLQTQAAMAAAEAHGIRFACAHLSDGDFLHRFTAGELRAEDFRHGDHLRFAWLALERLPFDMAEESVAQNLRAFLRRISGSNAQFSRNLYPRLGPRARQHARTHLCRRTWPPTPQSCTARHSAATGPRSCCTAPLRAPCAVPH